MLGNGIGLYYVHKVPDVTPKGNWNSTILSIDFDNKTYTKYISCADLTNNKNFVEVVKRDAIADFMEKLQEKGFEEVDYGEDSSILQ